MNKNIIAKYCIVAIFFLYGCGQSNQGPEPLNSTPWVSGLVLGNSTLNSKLIVTNELLDEDSVQQHGVFLSELPNADFEWYSVKIYVPTSTELYTTEVGRAVVHVCHSGGKLSLPIDSSLSGSVGIEEFWGNTYSVFELIVHDLNRVVNDTSFQKLNGQLTYLILVENRKTL